MKQRKRIIQLIILMGIWVGGCDIDDISSSEGKIVFAGSPEGLTYEIYSIDATGKNRKRLTNGRNSWLIIPCYSPDGRKILFESEGEIYIMDANGKNQRQLTNTPGVNGDPSYSPDGKKIVFVSLTRDAEESEIYIMDADGKNQTRLTDTPGLNLDPTYSPDGKKIVFLSTRDGGRGLAGSEIYIMDADGKNQTRLTYNQTEDDCPCWTPDSRRIIFLSKRDGNPEIYIMDADGKNQTRLTYNGFFLAQRPICSPDGQKIAFATRKELYIMDIDGKNQIKLTDRTQCCIEDDTNGLLSWSPDGKKICFVGYKYKGNIFSEDIYTINKDGTNLKNLTNTPDRSEKWPSWRPVVK